MTVQDLALAEALSGAEMGTLIVPIDGVTDIAEVEAEINRYRLSGANIAVLGLAASCAQAGRLEMGRLFDTLVSMEWASAPEILRRFVTSHRTFVQNRAFKAFLDHAVDGYWIWLLESDQIEWSERTRVMTRTAHADVPRDIGSFINMVHPQDRDRVEQAVRNHLEHGAPYKNIEMRLLQGDGSYGHFLANGRALRDETGHPIILVGSLTDRTLMQKVEQQLEDTQKRFTVLFHHMNDAAVLADIETGLILEANQPAERLWGKSIAELVGSHQTQLHPPNLSDEAKQAFADHIEALMKNKRDSIHVPILRADGTEVPAEISSSLIEIEGKTSILGVFRDISERVKAERDLRERDAQIQLSSHLASMGTLAAGVAHEINNPLTYVLGNLEMVKVLLDERQINDREIAEAIDAASTGGRYVREIVSDLKAISRMDSTEGHCDPCEVIRIASRMAMSDLRHRAQLDMSLAEVPEVPISSARLSQVVLNILSNASRAFSSPDRQHNRIRVDVHEAGGLVRILIEDNGSGISAEDLKRVWEPFFTKRSEKGGTGLGLSICRRILHEVHGTLEIVSELGVGTQVTITLPFAKSDSPEPQATPAPVTKEAERKVRLLVVDDDTLVTTLIQRMLQRDYDLTVRNDARKALEEIRAGAQFDIVLCDIMMPDLDGRAFHEAVGDKMPFLFLTGGAVTQQNIEFERRMSAEGRLMHKPFEAAELRHRLTQIVTEVTRTAIVGTDGSQPRQPEPHVLSELEELLGRDVLREQFGKLLRQIQQISAHAPGVRMEELANEAHRIAGAADVMGLRRIGNHLRKCQEAAASGDAEQALHEIRVVRTMQDDFAAFVENY